VIRVRAAITHRDNEFVLSAVVSHPGKTIRLRRVRKHACKKLEQHGKPYALRKAPQIAGSEVVHRMSRPREGVRASRSSRQRQTILLGSVWVTQAQLLRAFGATAEATGCFSCVPDRRQRLGATDDLSPREPGIRVSARYRRDTTLRRRPVSR
jgi:hypothetical protein